MGVPVFGINAWKRSTSALERKNAKVDKHWDGLRFWTLGWIVNLNLGWVAFLILKELAKRLCYWLWEWGERGVDQRRENDQRMIRENGAKCSRDRDFQDWWQTVNRDEPARQPGQVHVDQYHCSGDRGLAGQKNDYHKKMKMWWKSDDR